MHTPGTGGFPSRRGPPAVGSCKAPRQRAACGRLGTPSNYRRPTAGVRRGSGVPHGTPRAGGRRGPAIKILGVRTGIEYSCDEDCRGRPRSGRTAGGGGNSRALKQSGVRKDEHAWVRRKEWFTETGSSLWGALARPPSCRGPPRAVWEAILHPARSG